MARSTGKTNKTQARCYCADLLAKGMLCSDTGISFCIYAKDFFSETSQWYADKKQVATGKKVPVARKTLAAYTEILENKLLPYFGKYKLADITSTHVKKFRAVLIERNLSNSYINIVCHVLSIIFKYAETDRYITTNPCTAVQSLSVNKRTRDAFSLEELECIFRQQWTNKERKLFAITAAVTGMRFSEIQGLRKEVIFQNYLDVNGQWDSKTKAITPVKTGESRKVRIPEWLSKCLLSYTKQSGFVFSECDNAYRNEFVAKIDVSQRKSRGLCFHSIRHFFNTFLLANNIPEIKVKAIMGHSSGRGSMTERYTNFRPEHFDDVEKLQSLLLEHFLCGDECITQPNN